MSNPIKYSTGSESLALKKGNFYIGTGDVGKGPSNTTGYYQGPDVPSGGYVIYMNKTGAPGDLSYHNAPTDAELISFTNSLAGQSYTTVNDCLTYYAGQTDKVCVNRDYEGIVTDGLIFNLDAGFTPSYPKNGTTWYDVGRTNNGTLTNGPTFSTDGGGSIVFDGVNDFMTNTTTTDYDLSLATIECWVKMNTADTNYFGIVSLFESGPYRGFGLNKTNGITKFNFIVTYNSDGTFKYIQANENYTLNTWYHVVGTVGATVANLYVNGVKQNDDRTYTTAISPTSIPITIGRFYHDTNAFYAPCTVAVAKVYNRALTDDEILQNYNAQKGRFGL